MVKLAVYADFLWKAGSGTFKNLLFVYNVNKYCLVVMTCEVMWHIFSSTVFK